MLFAILDQTFDTFINQQQFVFMIQNIRTATRAYFDNNNMTCSGERKIENFERLHSLHIQVVKALAYDKQNLINLYQNIELNTKSALIIQKLQIEIAEKELFQQKYILTIVLEQIAKETEKLYKQQQRPAEEQSIENLYMPDQEQEQARHLLSQCNIIQKQHEKLKQKRLTFKSLKQKMKNKPKKIGQNQLLFRDHIWQCQIESAIGQDAQICNQFKQQFFIKGRKWYKSFGQKQFSEKLFFQGNEWKCEEKVGSFDNIQKLYYFGKLWLCRHSFDKSFFCHETLDDN